MVAEPGLPGTFARAGRRHAHMIASSALRRRPRILLLSFLIALMAPAGAVSAQSASPSTSSSASASGGAIASTVSADADAQIAARIRGIFAEIGSLNGIDVRVAAGVVTLSGQVADENAIAQAQAIAGRVAGVVTVQNRVTRNLAVDSNLDPALSGVRGKFTGLVAALPLIGVSIALAVLIGMLGYTIAGRKNLWHRVAPNPFLAELLASAIRFAFVVAGIVLALDIVGATALLGAVLGGAGVFGIAVGFAVKDTIDNYVSSLMLSIRQPFRANDHVKIDSWEGRVVRLTSRATVLMTLDGNHLRIPNSTVFKAVIVNFTTNPTRRFSFEVGIDPAADPSAARAVALEAMRGQDFVLPAPEPSTEVVSIDGATQVLRFTGWVDQTQTGFGKARTLVIEAVRRALRGQGFALPDTVYHVRMEQDAGEAAPKAEAPPVENAGAESVAPEHHIETMVDRERAGNAQGRDLLDASRPTE